ncbi:hypothetical protein [Amycolatopsis sp. NPDC051371]|uniref:hypothetical protein n=1 Tax=Amycolatopsis sp. NPDC051371 TaxID=3155800 RepID=UPI003428BD69
MSETSDAPEAPEPPPDPPDGDRAEGPVEDEEPGTAESSEAPPEEGPVEDGAQPVDSAEAPVPEEGPVEDDEPAPDNAEVPEEKATDETDGAEELPPAGDDAGEAEDPNPPENTNAEETEDPNPPEDTEGAEDHTDEGERLEDDTTADETDRRDDEDTEPTEDRAQPEDDQSDTGADDPDDVERERELKPDDPRWDGPWNSTTPEAQTEQPAAEAESTEQEHQEPAESPQEAEPNRDERQEPATERDAPPEHGDFERERELNPRAQAGNESSAEARVEQQAPSREIPEIPGGPEQAEARPEDPQRTPVEIPARQDQQELDLGVRQTGADSSEVRLADGAETRDSGRPRGPDASAGDPPDDPGADDDPGGPPPPESRIPELGPNDYLAVVNERGELEERQTPGQPAPERDKPNREEVGVAEDDVPEDPEKDELEESEEAEEYVDSVIEGRPENEKKAETSDEKPRTGHEKTEIRTGHEARIDSVPPPEPTIGVLTSAALGIAALSERGLKGFTDTFRSLRGGEPSMMPEEPPDPEEDDKK